jgi:hypothetical protein
MENGPSRMPAILNKHAGEILVDWTTNLADTFKMTAESASPSCPVRHANFLCCLEPLWVVRVV